MRVKIGSSPVGKDLHHTVETKTNESGGHAAEVVCLSSSRLHIDLLVT